MIKKSKCNSVNFKKWGSNLIKIITAFDDIKLKYFTLNIENHLCERPNIPGLQNMSS